MVKGIMLRNAVQIIHKPKEAKIIVDPIRREILRQLNIRSQTATQLAEKLNLTKSTVGHHVRVLRKARLIRIKLAKPGHHGILEKYYEPVAALFIGDHNRMSSDLRNYFLYIHMERLRGIFAAFQLLSESKKRTFKIPAEVDLLSELAKEIAKHITRIAERYENTETEMGAEDLFAKIYGEALKTVMMKGIWRKVFADMNQVGTLILKEQVSGP